MFFFRFSPSRDGRGQVPRGGRRRDGHSLAALSLPRRKLSLFSTPLFSASTAKNNNAKRTQIVDGSLVEVFASSGEALTTRVYRGESGSGSGSASGSGSGSGGGGSGSASGSASGSGGGGEKEKGSRDRSDQNQNHHYYLLAKAGGKGGGGGGVVTASRARAWGMRSCWEE
jgi:hypothetical protein